MFDRRRDRGRARLAVGDLPPHAPDRPARATRRASALGGAVRVRGRRPPARDRRLGDCGVAAGAAVARPRRRARRRHRSFALLGIALGYWAPPKGALPIANLPYLVLAYAGGLWIRPGSLPHAVARASPYLPTRAFADALVAASAGRARRLARVGRARVLRGRLRLRGGSRLPQGRRAAVRLRLAATDPHTHAAVSRRLPALTVWEIILMLVVLKIPVAYVGWVIWWAIKAEPEVGTEGGTEGVNWRPWRRPSPTASPVRPRRGGPHGAPTRADERPSRRQERTSGATA